MIYLAGIVVKEQIYESANSLVYRAIKQADQTAIILKFLKEDYPTPAELARYQQEYEITHSLNLEGVIKAYSLQDYHRTKVLILEDFGGESLQQLIKPSEEEYCPMPLTEFLKLAIKITEILAGIHGANVIHKDINPGNIVLNPKTGQVKIIDFGISTRLTYTNPTLSHPNVLEGTLAYMSPEQTGRMNRSLDYRTDFYSLGVTFYELLTGQLPFTTTDVLELVHCHIAKQPVPPHLLPQWEREKETRSTLNPQQCPKAVSNILMKLMAKTAEERYRSAWGIVADLEECLLQLETTGRIKEFQLGIYDTSDKFLIPQKLYGREAEVATLLAAFERVVGTDELLVSSSKLKEPIQDEKLTPQTLHNEMMLVTGYAGIGKSALIAEIYKPLTRQKGYFISGKFDQFKRNIPYSALVTALTQLVRQLLTETEANLNQWRSKLLLALGSNFQLIIDFIPEIELIIDKQPSIPELGLTESQNRFNLVFQNFIRVFCNRKHPLVIFLDDLQWADTATLKLLQLMMTDTYTQYLFLIGAYRDNEVSPSHPLMSALDGLRQAGVIIHQIILAPLGLTHVSQLIADTLHSDIETVKPLAEMVLQKTEGNPFFVKEFLKNLYAENLITFSSEGVRTQDDKPRQHPQWQWDMATIQMMDITENVVELMILALNKLPESTQEMLRFAACIGTNFDLKTLSIISGKSQPDVFHDLGEAIQEGLIFAASELDEQLLTQNYKFRHDRIQQAANTLIADDDKKALHLQIGRLLLQNSSPDQLLEQIFTIVDHLNLGIELIYPQNERNEIARLNLIAGKKAKSATAYDSAIQYFKVGRELLGEDSWEAVYDLTLALYRESVEAEYLNANYEQVEALSTIVLQRAKTTLEKINIYVIKILFCSAQNQMQVAIDLGLEVLALLGVSLSESEPQVLKVDELYNLPTMTNPDKEAALRVLMILFAPIYITNPTLLPSLSFTLVKLCIDYGNSPLAAYAYGLYGLILCGILGDIELGYQFGILALKILDKFESKEIECRVYNNFYSFIIHWQEAARKSLQPLRDTVQMGLETGEIEFTCYAATNYCQNLVLIGEPLEYVASEIENYIALIRSLKQEYQVSYLQAWKTFVSHLISRPEGSEPSTVDSDGLEKLSNLIPRQDLSLSYHLYLAKTIVYYLFKDYSQAVANTKILEECESGIVGLFPSSQSPFYRSLSLLSHYPSVSDSEQIEYLQKVEANQKKLKAWADHAPMNYLHKYHLVEAEKARVLGQNWEATELYERAIQGAIESQYLHEEALAYELAAEFYLAQGRTKIAQTYLIEAHYGYRRWQAKSKMKDLEERYSQFFSQKPSSLSTNPTTPSSTSTEIATTLDLTSILKASQALSGELALERLLSQMMRIVIENAAAQIGYLILNKDEKWVIEASGTVAPDEVQVLQSIPIERVSGNNETPRVSNAIANYVIRTQKSIVLHDAAHEGEFTQDSYILQQQPKSILCMPLIHQGKLVGILYLENNLTTGAFTPDRLEVLHLLSSQAAISIENAKLYAQLRESESKWTQLLEAVPVGVSLHTADGKVSYINQTGQHLIQHSINTEASSEQIAQTYNLYRAGTDQLYPTDQLPALRALKGEHVIVDDIEVHHEGNIIPFELRSTPVFDNNGHVIYAVSAFQDISDRKQTEKLLTDYNRTLAAEVTQRTAELTQINQQLEREIVERQQAEEALRASEARFRALAQVSPDIITLSSPDCGVFYQSPAVERILGYSPSEFIGEKPLQVLHPEDRPALEAAIARELANPGVPVTVEYRLQHKDGTWVWLEGVATNWLDEPALGALMIISRDIRDRKRTQDALQQSEARYRAIVEDQTELVSRFLPDGTLTFINEAYCRYFGVKREDLIGNHYAPVVWEDDLEYIEQQVQSISRDNPVVIIENRVVVAGEIRWTQWINRALFNQQGDLVELQSIGRDISDKKQVELALQKSERRYRQIVQTADEGIWVIDSEGNTTFANPKMAQMLGYGIQEMLGMPIFAFMDEEWQVLAKQNLERRRQDIVGKYDFKLRRKDGSALWVMVASNPIFDESGQYTGALKMMTDITQRKSAEDALRRYERIVSTTTDAIALIDRNYRYQIVNQTYLSWRQKPNEEILGHSVSEIVGADVFDNVVKLLLDRSLAGETIHYQAWFDYEPEKRKFLSINYVPYVEPDHTISGVVISLRDLTKLKQAEEELQRSEERLQLAFEGSGDGFWDWNIATGEIYWNPQWFKMLGYEADEFPGGFSNWEQVVHPDDLPWITEKLNAHLKDASVLYNCDYRLQTKSGTWKWISTYGRVVARDEQGTPMRMAGIHRDINDKKQAEEALRESEQRYRQMIETAEEGIWIIDLQGKTQFANPKMAQMLGCTVEDLLGLTMFDFMDEEGIAIANRNLERRRQGIQEKHDFKFRRNDGSELWVIISTSPILNESGQSTGALGMLTDITQRKQTEEALERSERLFRLLAEISPVGIFRSNASGQTIYANDRACQIVGAPLDEVLGWGWGSYIHPEDANRVQQTWQYSMTHQVPWQDEYRLLNPQGKVVWVLAQAEVERDETGNVMGYVGTLTDISDRKATETALREQKELLQAIFDHIPIMLCFYNAEAQVELVNPVMEHTIGWSLEEFRQIDVMAECYPDPDYRAALFEFMMRADGTWRDVQLRTRAGTLLETCWANVRLPNGWQVGIGQDITDRKQADQALRESEQRFREIAETISQFFFVRSATSGQYLYVNPAYEQIWGRTCESLYQNPLSWLETIHPDDRPLVLNSLQAQFNGKPVKREYRIIRADGQVRWIVADISVVFDEAGQPLRFVGLAEDITERKQAEEALRESESRFRAVFEQAAVGIGLCTLDGRFFRVNQKLCDIIGYTRDEMLERTFQAITTVKDRPQLQASIYQLLAGEIKNYSLENRYICKDGSVVWANVAVSLRHEPHGEPKCFIYIAEDISDRKDAELALIKSEHTLAEAQRLAHLGNWSFDLLNRELTWSDETFRIYGLDPTQDEPTEEQHLQQIHPDDREQVLRSSERAITQAIPYEHEMRIFLPDGSMRYTLGRGQPVLDEAGQVVQLFGTVQDITERIRAEEELRESEAKFRQLAENIQEVFFILSLSGEIVYISPAYEQIWGRTCDSLYQNPLSWLESVHPEEQPQMVAALQHQIRDTAEFDEIYRILRPDGETRWIRARSFPIEHHNSYRFVGIAEDITASKQAEETLQQAKLAAEAANQAKSAFLANMSHELRTPLNAILGFSQLMHKSSNLSPEHQKNLGTIIRSGEHLLTLINQVLDLSKIEAGRTTLNETDFDLYRLLDDLQDLFQLKANHKRLQLHFDRSPDVPQYIRTDEVKLRQVLINLLSNAMKFTASGGVSVRVSRGIENEQDPMNGPSFISDSSLQFAVEDTGSGIAREELDCIFEAFVQTKTGQQFQEGTGLGLTITRKFVELMGGEISVSSQVGRGTTFTFDIRVQVTETPDLKRQQPTRRAIALEPNQPHYRLLIVDDLVDNRQVLSNLLAPFGFELQEASNGLEAIAIWDAWQPHVILMDMRMPMMDGYEATQRIKSIITKGQATVIIAVTASSLEEERETILSAGCDDFIRKPFHEQEIFDALHHHIGVRFVYDESTAKTTETETDILIPSALASLPPDLVAGFHSALIELDVKLIQTLITEIREYNEPLANALATFANNFQYEELLNFIPPVGGLK